MRIGGFVKQSFIDWDGMLCAVVFTKGCNLRCGYCHNPSLVVPSLMARYEDIPASQVLEYLSSRRDWLDGVVVSGGEPTVQEDLPEFLSAVKAMGYRIKLDTNGTNPAMLERMCSEGLVDFVAMDIKHIPRRREYSRITPVSAVMAKSIRLSIRILNKGKIPYMFRTTVIPAIHTPEVVSELRRRFNDERYVWYHFRRTGVDGTVGDYSE